MLSMNNLSITQKFNNNRIEGQKFHQSPMISNTNRMSQHDTVSFGRFFDEMGIEVFKNLPPMREEFIAKLDFGSPESIIHFMDDIKAKSPRLQKAFLLFPNEEGNSLFVNVIKQRPEIADKFLDFVTCLDNKLQNEFALMRNDKGHTHFDIALQHNRPDVAMDFLNFVGVLNMPIQRKFALSRTTYGFENQYNVALGLGHYDAAKAFLDFVKRIGNNTPSKFFLLQDIQGKLPFEAVIKTGNQQVLENFADFTSKAVAREYLLKQLQEALAIDTLHAENAMEREAVRHLADSNTSNPFFPSGFWKMPDTSPAKQVQA